MRARLGLSLPSKKETRGSEQKGNDLISSRHTTEGPGPEACGDVMFLDYCRADPTRRKGAGSSSSHVTRVQYIYTWTPYYTLLDPPRPLPLPSPPFSPSKIHGGTVHTCNIVGLDAGHLCRSQAVSLAVTCCIGIPRTGKVVEGRGQTIESLPG